VNTPTGREGATPRKSPQQRRAGILRALNEAMSDTPWKRLEIRQVMALEQASPATFYRHFPDLEAAILALAHDLAPDVPGHVLRVLRLIAAEGYPGARRALAAATTPTTERPDQ